MTEWGVVLLQPSWFVVHENNQKNQKMMSSNENSAPMTAATLNKAFKDTMNPFGQVDRGSSSSVGFELIPKRKPIKPSGTNAEPATLHKIAPKSALNQRGQR